MNWIDKTVRVLVILFVISAIFYYRIPIQRSLVTLGERTGLIALCSRPITYSLGAFDDRFGISKEDFLKGLDTAAGVWETELDRNLFEYSANATVKVDLIYDERQEVTEKLHTIDQSLKEGMGKYEDTKARYTTLSQKYSLERTELQKSINSYEAKKNAYEKSVTHWNSQGGAPRDDFEKLEKERAELTADLITLNKKTEYLKTTVDSLNSTVNELNKLAKEYNLKVGTYNQVGTTVGKEFDEGEYVQDEKGTRITVYQFENQTKLARVLTHELGHALGLEHVDDPKAIMYRLNIGVNEKLAPDDVRELKRVCKIEK